MERRFTRAWKEIDVQRRDGASLADIVAATRSDTLIAALAGAAQDDPVAANVIATELLNRVNRAPFLGAAVVSAVTILILFMLEWIYTGTPFVIEEASPRAYMLILFSALIALASLIAWFMWRGRFPTLRSWLLGRYKRDY